MASLPSRTRRVSPASRSRRAEDARRRILDAAAACFADAGFRRTRFEDIAAGAGVSRALVYAYFESKENLLRAVRDQALSGWRAAVEPTLSREPGAVATLRAMVRNTLLYARTRPMLRAILAEDTRVVLMGQGEPGRRAIEEWRRLLIDVLERGVTEGELRADLDVPHTADVLRALLVGIIDRMHRRDGPIDVSSEAHVEAAVALALYGLGADGRGPAR